LNELKHFGRTHPAIHQQRSDYSQATRRFEINSIKQTCDLNKRLNS